MSAMTELYDRVAAISPTVGPVFINHRPASPDACVTITKYPGAPPTGGFGDAGIRYETMGVQFAVRGARDDNDGPEGIAYRVWRNIAEIQAATLGSTFYLMAHSQGSPVLIETDQNGRRVFACSFQIEKEPS
jgi:hypothetical protein